MRWVDTTPGSWADWFRRACGPAEPGNSRSLAGRLTIPTDRAAFNEIDMKAALVSDQLLCKCCNICAVHPAVAIAIRAESAHLLGFSP